MPHSRQTGKVGASASQQKTIDTPKDFADVAWLEAFGAVAIPGALNQSTVLPAERR